MTETDIEPPESVSEDVITALEGYDDTQLREVIHYAQRLLQQHPALTDAIESRPGEALVRTEDHGAYTIAVVERPDEAGGARGPFAYRVAWDPATEEGDGQYRWHYLGRLHGDSEESA